MSAVETVDVEVWVMIGEDGQYTAHTDESALRERFDEECPDAGLVTRVVRITVKVPKPKPVELEATIAAEPDNAELKVA